MSVRVCFEFRVRPEAQEEYLKRHDPVSPGMLAELHRAGIRDYSIFLGDGGRLVGVYSTDDPAATDAHLAASSVARQWDRIMRPLFVVDTSTREVARPLREVFHLETQLGA